MNIKISEIENTEKKISDVNFSKIFEEFNKDIPVEAKLHIEVIGTLIKISGRIKAKLNLVCDLCLKEFTKEFDFEVEELFTKYGLNPSISDEFEIKQNSFIEDLNGKDDIDLADFVYQSVILHIPNKLVCDINCNGSEIVNKYIKTDFTDPRLEIFKNIKLEKE